MILDRSVSGDAQDNGSSECAEWEMICSLFIPSAKSRRKPSARVRQRLQLNLIECVFDRMDVIQHRRVRIDRIAR